MKKTLLTLGSIITITTPIAAVVSCGDNNDTALNFHNEIELATDIKLSNQNMDSLLNDVHNDLGIEASKITKLKPTKGHHWSTYGSQSSIAALAITFEIKNEPPVDSNTAADVVSINGGVLNHGDIIRIVSGMAQNDLGNGLKILRKPKGQDKFLMMPSQTLEHGVSDKLLTTLIKLMSWDNANAEVDKSILNAIASNIHATQTSTLNAVALDTLLNGHPEGFVVTATQLGITSPTDARANVTYKLRAYDATKHQALIVASVVDKNHADNKVEKQITLTAS